MMPIVKTCSCKRTYTLASWLALRPASGGAVGDDGRGGILLYRNCVCGSTMARRPLTRPIEPFTDEEIAEATKAMPMPLAAWLRHLTDPFAEGEPAPPAA